MAVAAEKTNAAISGYAEARSSLQAAMQDNGADVCGPAAAKDVFSLNSSDVTQPSPIGYALKTGASMLIAAAVPIAAPVLAVADFVGAVQGGLHMQHASLTKSTENYTDSSGDTYTLDGRKLELQPTEIDISKIMVQGPSSNNPSGSLPDAKHFNPLHANAQSILKEQGSTNVLKSLHQKTAHEEKITMDAGLIHQQSLRYGYHLAEITTPKGGGLMGRA